jgi:putative tricarboxylic transport membrane protein
MDVINQLGMGFGVVCTVGNLLFCFLGCLIGTLIGVLPGLGPVATLSLLLPITFGMEPISSIILLAGVYYGAQYGGSTTSILVNIPGEAASIVTCLDGYQLARQGRAGAALGMSAFGSFIGGTASVVGLMLLAPVLAEVALTFGPPEYFSLMFFGLTLVIYLCSGSIAKGLIMAAAGLALSLVGQDPVSGVTRFTLGSITLMDGFGIAPVAMGMFGIGEVLTNMEQSAPQEVLATRIKGLLPTLQDWKDSAWPIVRASVLGFFVGVLPGSGGIITTFMSYTLEKKLSRHPEKFGTGLIEGVAAPETANNATTGGSMVPLLSLGIPSNASMAVLLGAFMIHGIHPGPLFIDEHPALFWGTIASMYIGNVMLVILNVPLIGLWVRILKIPYSILAPLILLFCFVGVYSINNNIYEILIMLGFGVFGYLVRKFGYEGAPFLLALVLGPMCEMTFRQSMLFGDPFILFKRPISLVLLTIALLLILSPVLSGILGKRKKRVEER